MKEININCKLNVFNDFSELTLEVQNLLNQAIVARKNAYAPYSNFQVGAAVLLDNQEIITGSNQENAAYPSGLCAERVAIFYAGAKYPKGKILKMAISAARQKSILNEPIPPCGACRQSIAEYEAKQDAPIEIYFMGEVGEVYQSDSLKNILPLVFNKNFL
jgi:cytidine deaminase